MRKEKKPPIRLEDIGKGKAANGEEKKPGELIYMSSEKGSPGVSGEGINRKQWIPAIVAVFFAGILVFGFSATKSDATVLDANIREVNDRVTAVDSQLVDIAKKADAAVASITEKVDTAVVEARSAKTALDDFARKSDIPALPDLSQYVKKGEVPEAIDLDLSEYVKKVDLEGYDSDLSDVSARVVALENGGTTTTGDTGDDTRWTTSVSFKYALTLGHQDLRVDVSPYRIGPGEGYYELELLFYTVGSAIVNARPIVYLTLTPRDDIVVERDAPYLITDTPPYTFWDTDVITRDRRGVTITRQIVFESDTFQIDLGADGEWNDEETFDLELELFYR